MTPVQPETQKFLDDVERSAGRKFMYRREAGLLLEEAERSGNRRAFDEVLFYAKFLSHASVILGRTGVSDDSTAKLSEEFREKLEKTSSLLRSILASTPDEDRRIITEPFLTLSHSSLDSLLSFLKELSWIKNYLLDKERSD